jgi:hypothetical protein
MRIDQSRRRFLAGATAASGAMLAAAHLPSRASRGQDGAKRPKVAALFTVFHFRSHAYNILENFLGPYYFSGQWTDPGVDVVAMYADQFPDNDMAREVSRRFKIPLFDSIESALCLGGKELAVDAVLSIAEHGDYPFNERGQQLYPRKKFFDQSVAVMKRSGRFVPFFNDKHLSYRWDWSREMVDTARMNKMPLMAGSSVPLAQRMPALEIAPGAKITEAVSIHGGGLESYDFHALEVLESIVESRSGGETGIASIELLIGDAFHKAKREGRWSNELVEAAMKAESKMSVSRQPWPKKGVFAKPPVTEEKHGRPPRPTGSHAIIVNYKDGLKATIVKEKASSDRWNFACRTVDAAAPQATAFFNSPWGNRGLFKALSHAIQQMFITGKESYPVERTLLTTGAVEATMRSYEQGGAVIATPELEFDWVPYDWSAMQENGDTWKKITVETQQPVEFRPGEPFK